MDTLTLIEDFSAFATRQLQGGREATIDALYDQWRERIFQSDDAKSILASVRDLENGERGQPLAEFLAEFSEERRAIEEQ